MVDYLLQGFACKNMRTRVDCVELLGEMLEEEGLAACLKTKQKPFAMMAEVPPLPSWPAPNNLNIHIH